MSDEPRIRGGWLPPAAPGSRPPPRFEARPAAEAAAAEAEPTAAAEARPAAEAAAAGAEPTAAADERPAWQPPGAHASPAAEAPPAWRPAPADRPTFVAAGPQQRNATAVWALVLGIAGLTLLLMSLGTLFIVTLPCSIAAWVLALRARERGPDAANQATAALWLGRIGVLAGVAAAVVLIALLASGFDFEQLREDLERELERQRRQDEEGGSDGVRTAVERLRALLRL